MSRGFASGRLRAQVIKELLSFLRDPRSRVALIVPPILQLFVFSFAATLEVDNVKIAVVNEDAGSASYELLARVRGAGFVADIDFVDSDAALATLLDRRQVLIGIHFPSDFSRDIAAGRQARAQVLIDGRRANAGQVAAGYLQTIATDLNIDLVGDGAHAVPQGVVRHWFNPNLRYQWFVVPALGAILALFSALIVTALSIARERELGTFDQLLVSPATPLEIIVGKTVPALIIGTLLGTIMIGCGVLIFRVPFTGSFAMLWLLLLLFILSVVGIGLMISSVCQTQQQAVLGTFAFAIPTILMSGFATPVENMPYALQIAAEADPLKHFLIIIQGSFLKALPMSVLWANAWPLAVIALVTLSTAALFVRGRLQ
jgi:ABC-2 type transport system permease protein